MKKTGFAVLALALAAGPAAAQITRTGATAAPIAQSVHVPGGAERLIVSGLTAPPLDGATTTPMYGDTRAQTAAILARLDGVLKAQGYGLGDVVMMRVYLVGDPALGGRMDFAGMMAAYKASFGTVAQPNKPARITVQVVALASPGLLCEIEAEAAKARP